MTNQVNGKWAHVLQYGLASAMAGVALGLVIYMAELNQNFGNLAFLFYIVFLIFALRSWSEKRGALGLSYGQAFGHAMLIALVNALISAVWAVVFVKVIAPGFIEAQQELQYDKLREQGMEESQIEMARSMGKRFSSAPIIFAIGLIWTLFVLTLINLITAAFFTRKPASPVDPSHIPANNPYSPFQSNGPPSDHA